MRIDCSRVSTSFTGRWVRNASSAVWDWIDDHPAEASLAYAHLPGATRQMSVLRREFDDLHVRRAFDYLSVHPGATQSPSNTARHAAATLAVRTLVDVLMAVQHVRMSGEGSLPKESPADLRAAVRAVSSRIVLVG